MQRLARESGKWGGNKFQSGSLLDTNQPFPGNRFSSKKTSHHRSNQKHLETINLVSTSASAAPMQATGPISRKNKHVLPSHAIRGGEGGQQDTNHIKDCGFYYYYVIVIKHIWSKSLNLSSLKVVTSPQIDRT